MPPSRCPAATGIVTDVTDTILVLTEDTLNTADVQKIVALYADDDVAFRVLVPADTEQSLLGALFENLDSGRFKEAWAVATAGVQNRTEARMAAGERMSTSVLEFENAGRDATGVVVEEDPLPALVSAVTSENAREVVIVTYLHFLEDTFHQDWASKAREELKVPVLHLLSGTSELG